MFTFFTFFTLLHFYAFLTMTFNSMLHIAVIIYN